ncbi:MAG: hypothetical protein ACRDL7_13315, partial [Gaiellaceae bacterium]
MESFAEQGINPEIQRLMHEAYSRRRIEMMDVASAERKKIIEGGETRNDRHVTNKLSQNLMTPADILAREEKVTSTLIETEKLRLEKMMERQKKNLLQKIQFEKKLQEAEAAMKDKEELATKISEVELKERDMKIRQAAEERRMQEIRRKAQEDAEEENRICLTQEANEREQKINKQREELERANKLRARALEEERRKKREEQKQETDRKIENIKQRVLRKAEEREAKEKQRILKLE